MIALLAWAACVGPWPVLVSVNDATYHYDPTGALNTISGDVPLIPGETVNLRLKVRNTREIHFANMPGIVSFDPMETSGTLEAFDELVDTGSSSYRLESIITLTNKGGVSRDFPFYYHFPRDSGDTGSTGSTGGTGEP